VVFLESTEKSSYTNSSYFYWPYITMELDK
jgi:hypothetical protein